MKLSTLVSLVTTIAVAGTASIVRNPVTFVSNFKAKAAKATKAPKAPKARTTTQSKKERGLRGAFRRFKRSSKSGGQATADTVPEAPVRRRPSARDPIAELSHNISLGCVNLLDNLPALSAGVFTHVVGFKQLAPLLLPDGLSHLLLDQDEVWRSGFECDTTGLDLLLFKFFHLMSEAKALNGKVLLALPPQFAAVLFAAYLMNLEDFFMSEAVTKLGTIFDRSDPHQLFGHHASQFLRWAGEGVKFPTRLFIIEGNEVYRHQGALSQDEETLKKSQSQAYLLHSGHNQYLGLGKNCASLTTKTASDLMWGFHEYARMRYAGEKGPMGDMELVSILYAISSWREAGGEEQWATENGIPPPALH